MKTVKWNDARRQAKGNDQQQRPKLHIDKQNDHSNNNW
jgi:hypothetical protein